MCMGMLSICVSVQHMHVWHPQKLEKTPDALKREFQRVGTGRVHAENQN